MSGDEAPGDRIIRTPALPILIFDGDCGFCTTCARLLQRWVVTSGSPSVAPWQRVDLAALGLTAEQCSEAVQWVGADRRVVSGHEAIAAVLSAGHAVWRPIGSLIVAPGFSWLAARVYRWVAAHRDAMPGGTPACKVNPTEPI